MIDSNIKICPMCCENHGQIAEENSVEFSGAFICEEHYLEISYIVKEHNENDEQFRRGNPVSVEGFFNFVTERTAWEELTNAEVSTVIDAYLILGEVK